MTQTPKHDKQGRAYYTIDQVKRMAEERGLVCRMIGNAIHPFTLEPLSLSRVWRRYYPHDYSTGRSTYSNIPEPTAQNRRTLISTPVISQR